MSDILTFICPQCGGQLQVTPYTRTIACPYCGTEQAVQVDYPKDAISANVMGCPICKRNDHIEKIAVAADRENDRDTESERPKALAAPKLELYESILANYRQIRPQPKTKPGMLGVLFPAGIFIAFIGFLEWFLITISDVCSVPVWIIMIILAVITFKHLVDKLPPALYPQDALDAENRHAHEKWQKGLDAMDVVIQSTRLQKKFWSDLYYCGRDDVVYMPAHGRYAPLANIDDFIESYLPEKYKFINLEELSEKFAAKYD